MRLKKVTKYKLIKIWLHSQMKKLESTCLPVVAWPWHILSCLTEKEKKIKSYLAKGMLGALFRCVTTTLLKVHP